MNSKELKEIAHTYGADIIGVAPVERFASLPANRNPLSIFPECKSVIVLARRILRGSLRGVEEGTNFGSTYWCFGVEYLEKNFLPKTTYDLTCWLEENGSEAVPLFGYGNDAKMEFGVPVAEGKPAPNVIVDPEFAAQAAGLAEMALGGFLLTQEFGTRQRWAIILTDAELEADEPKKKSLCSDCKACINACPLGAYSNKTTNKGVPGYECSVADIDLEICRKCQNGARELHGQGGSIDRLSAICARTCMVQLEKNKKLNTQFKNDFRKRKPWVKDALGRASLAATINIGCDTSGK